MECAGADSSSNRNCLISPQHPRAVSPRGVGGAAHPMLPHLGQGANRSIEDGMALAMIPARVDAVSAPAALLAYERLRRERVAAVQRGARENGIRYDSSYADLRVRGAEISAHAAFRKKLYDHNVVPEAEAAVTALTQNGRA
jgi:salicylate hydroxylase